MDRINQFAFYEMGYLLHPFESSRDYTPADFNMFFKLLRAQTNLESLLDGSPIELGVSKEKAKELKTVIDTIIDQHFRDESDKSLKPDGIGKAIPSWRWNQAKRAVEGFETVFREEMREATTYRVPKRGIYDVAKLVDAAECTFPATLMSDISDKAQQEWRAGGRCLAFGLLSASGFHVARSVEAVLEDYHATFVTKPSKKKMTWGDYLSDLKAASAPNPSPDQKTLSEIEQMKDDWRNPLMHPRVILDEPQARMLFSNGESLIIAMASEIRNAKQ